MQSDRYADLDLLILYDPFRCPAERAHHDHRAFIDGLAERLDVPVHLCLLSYREEQAAGFNTQVSAVPILLSPT